MSIQRYITLSAPLNYSSAKDDALWSLNEYLNAYLPDGGDFWKGNQQDFSQGTGDADRFLW